MAKKTDFKTAYDAGYDAGINGANTINCNFRWFITKEFSEEWSRGNADAKKLREVGKYNKLKSK